MSYKSRLLMIILSLLAIWQYTTPALAHDTITVGPYALTIGWEIEPPLVGERNTLLVVIKEQEQPVTDAESGLSVGLSYAGRERWGKFLPTAVPGQYAFELIPTVRGQYTLKLQGQIGEQEVDVTFEPEEVEPATQLEFPESTTTSTHAAPVAEPPVWPGWVAGSSLVVSLVSLGVAVWSTRRKTA